MRGSVAIGGKSIDGREEVWVMPEGRRRVRRVDT